MAKGTFAGTATTSEVVAVGATRKSITLQLVSGSPTFVGIGEAAVYGEGIGMLVAGDFVTIGIHQAKLAINCICDTGLTSVGSWQDTKE